MLYSEIIGQDKLKMRLRDMVNGDKIPHAILFAGNSGVGQLPLALATAQYVCCENRSATDSCGVCPSCVKFAKLSHPDLHLTFPIVKSATKGVDICDNVVEEFRKNVMANPYLTVNDWFAETGDGKAGMIYAKEGDEIIRKLSFKPYESEYKVMIIWHPDLMHESCANHLLKFIEEPPEKTLFFLVTDNEERILGTIRSRSQRVIVPPIDIEDIKSAAKNKFSLSEGELDLYARLSNGSWRRFEDELKQSDETTRDFELFVRMMRLAWGLNVKEIKEWSEEMAALGRDEQKMFLRLAQKEMRENFISHTHNPQLLYMNASEAAFSTKFAKFIHERNIEMLMDELELAEAHIDQNINSKIVFFHLIFCLYKLLRIPNQ